MPKNAWRDVMEKMLVTFGIMMEVNGVVFDIIIMVDQKKPLHILLVQRTVPLVSIQTFTSQGQRVHSFQHVIL